MRNLKAFLLGIAEFRLAFTTHHTDWREAVCYDKGRELAHKLTFRHFEQ